VCVCVRVCVFVCVRCSPSHSFPAAHLPASAAASQRSRSPSSAHAPPPPPAPPPSTACRPHAPVRAWAQSRWCPGRGGSLAQGLHCTAPDHLVVVEAAACVCRAVQKNKYLINPGLIAEIRNLHLAAINIVWLHHLVPSHHMSRNARLPRPRTLAMHRLATATLSTPLIPTAECRPLLSHAAVHTSCAGLS
jgi:hypothetical protein